MDTRQKAVSKIYDPSNNSEPPQDFIALCESISKGFGPSEGFKGFDFGQPNQIIKIPVEDNSEVLCASKINVETIKGLSLEELKRWYIHNHSFITEEQFKAYIERCAELLMNNKGLEEKEVTLKKDTNSNHEEEYSSECLETKYIIENRVRAFESAGFKRVQDPLRELDRKILGAFFKEIALKELKDVFSYNALMQVLCEKDEEIYFKYFHFDQYTHDDKLVETLAKSSYLSEKQIHAELKRIAELTWDKFGPAFDDLDIHRRRLIAEKFIEMIINIYADKLSSNEIKWLMDLDRLDVYQDYLYLTYDSDYFLKIQYSLAEVFNVTVEQIKRDFAKFKYLILKQYETTLDARYNAKFCLEELEEEDELADEPELHDELDMEVEVPTAEELAEYDLFRSECLNRETENRFGIATPLSEDDTYYNDESECDFSDEEVYKLLDEINDEFESVKDQCIIFENDMFGFNLNISEVLNGLSRKQLNDIEKMIDKEMFGRVENGNQPDEAKVKEATNVTDDFIIEIENNFYTFKLSIYQFLKTLSFNELQNFSLEVTRIDLDKLMEEDD